MNRLRQYFTLGAIIGGLPVTLADGQIADAVPVMANFNWIVSQVNANALPGLGLTDIQVSQQSSPALTSGVNYPICKGGTISKDALNEFSTVTGVFTAINAGVYLLCGFANMLTNGATYSSGCVISRVGGLTNLAIGATAPPGTTTQAGTWVESITLAPGGTINLYMNASFTGGPPTITFGQMTIIRLR
jgi:hypothetical protein